MQFTTYGVSIILYHMELDSSKSQNLKNVIVLTLPSLEFVSLVNAINHPRIWWLPWNFYRGWANSFCFDFFWWGCWDSLFSLNFDAMGVDSYTFDIICSNLNLILLPDYQPFNKIIVLVLEIKVGMSSSWVYKKTKAVFVYLLINQFIYHPNHLSTYPSIYMCAYISVCLFLHTFI